MSLGLMIDKKTKRFVKLIFYQVREHVLKPQVSALSLRLFGKDITTVGQQKAKNESESQARGHQTETPVEHAPVVEEDKEPMPVIDDDYYMVEEVGETSER